MCVKWGNCMSDYFYISNGVRQGGILSPKLYSVYVDDLSDYLVNPIRSGGGGFKSPPPIFRSHAFNFGAALLCVGDFSQKIVKHRVAKKFFGSWVMIWL